MILVVEDEEAAREAICEILADAGFSAAPVENGQRALESALAATVAPELIMLDLAMPVMDGWTFLARMATHAKLAAVPVIVMSADVNARRLRFQRPLHVKEVLVKPIDVQRMIELVRKYAAEPRG